MLVGWQRKGTSRLTSNRASPSPGQIGVESPSAVPSNKTTPQAGGVVARLSNIGGRVGLVGSVREENKARSGWDLPGSFEPGAIPQPFTPLIPRDRQSPIATAYQQKPASCWLAIAEGLNQAPFCARIGEWRAHYGSVLRGRAGRRPGRLGRPAPPERGAAVGRRGQGQVRGPPGWAPGRCACGWAPCRRALALLRVHGGVVACRCLPGLRVFPAFPIAILPRWG